MAYLGSMQDACQHEPSKDDLARHESPSSSVNRVSDQCSRTEGYGFNFQWGLTLTYGISHLKVAEKKRCQKVGIPLVDLTNVNYKIEY